MMSSKEVEPTLKTARQPPPSFSSLPDEIIENILACVSRWSYPSLSLVSKRFHSLLSCTQIYKTRSLIGAKETCSYVSLRFPNHPNPSLFSLWTKPMINPEPNGEETLGFRNDSNGTSVIPTPFISFHCPPFSHHVCEVGSEIYVIGGPTDAPSSSVMILDCQTHNWREAPNMTVAREDPCVNLLDEKIYVMGGCSIDEYSASWFEVFEIKTQSWTALPGPGPDVDELRNHLREKNTYYVAEVFEGKLYVATLNGRDYIYNTKNGTWKVVGEQSGSIPQDILGWYKVGNILYGCNDTGYIVWSDSFFVNEGRKWKEIKGLENLCKPMELKYGDVVDMHYHDEKLVVMWYPLRSDIKGRNEIWYAKISLESRSSCNGRDIWGKVECLDVLRFPGESFDFVGYYVVSV